MGNIEVCCHKQPHSQLLTTIKQLAGWLVKKALWVDKKIEQFILREKKSESFFLFLFLLFLFLTSSYHSKTADLKEALYKADHNQEEKLEEETLKNFTKATRMYKVCGVGVVNMWLFF